VQILGLLLHGPQRNVGNLRRPHHHHSHPRRGLALACVPRHVADRLADPQRPIRASGDAGLQRDQQLGGRNQAPLARLAAVGNSYVANNESRSRSKIWVVYYYLSRWWRRPTTDDD